MKNYYSILGLDRTATDEEVGRSYRLLAMACHPDAWGGQGRDFETQVTRLFRGINEAYEVLGDSGRRAAYDVEFDRSSDGPAPTSPRRRPRHEGRLDLLG